MRRIFGVLLVGALLLASGCALFGPGGPSDEERIADLLAKYVVATEALDGEAIMAMTSEDYTNQWGGDRASVGDFFDQMKENGGALSMDVETAVVSIDGKTATVEDVTLSSDQGSALAIYTLSKEDGRWLVSGLEMPGM